MPNTQVQKGNKVTVLVVTFWQSYFVSKEVQWELSFDITANKGSLIKTCKTIWQSVTTIDSNFTQHNGPFVSLYM